MPSNFRLGALITASYLTAIILAYLHPVVQSIVSLTSSLIGQLVKCFTTLLPNIMVFFVEKMKEAFALQKLLIFFQQKIGTFQIYMFEICTEH